MSDELQFAHYPFEGEGLPESWEITALNNVLENIRPGFASGQHNKDGEGIPHLRPMNISPSGSIDLSEVLYVQGDNSLRLRRGDVLFNNTNSPAWVGKTALIEIDDELAFSNHMTRLRISLAVDPKFIAKQLHFLCSQGYFRHHCKKHVNQASIATEFLSRCVPVRIPPAVEQRHIVAKIEALQERSRRAREALSEAGPLLEQFRQSVLAAAFQGDLTADWRAAHPNAEPASELLHRIRTERRRQWEQGELAKYEAKEQKPPQNWKDKYKESEPVDDSDLLELPEGWAWATIDEISSLIVDCPHSTPQWTDEGKLCVRTTEFRPGKLDLTNARFVSVETFNERIQRLKPQPGDILYSREGGILGISCQVPADTELCLGQRMMLMRTDVHFLSSLLMHWLNSPRTLDRVKRVTSGSASPHLNVGEVKRFPVPVAPIEEQSKLLETIESCLATPEVCAQVAMDYEQQLDHLDQSILAKAFRGELVPQDTGDEPASVLLERIRAQPNRQLKAQKQTSKSYQTSKTGKKSSLLTPQQLTLDEVLSNKA
jgi:type I restriction enzyme S subunit